MAVQGAFPARPPVGAPPAPPAAVAAAPNAWICSPAYDLALFTLSPLAGLTAIAIFLIWPGPIGLVLNAALTFLVAIPHYVSSFSFYFGDESYAHYRSRWAAFFLGPVVIVALTCALWMLHFVAVVQVVIFLWNIWHVSFQSSGILSIYRRLAGGGMAERVPARVGILAVNSAMALWFADRFEPLHRAMVMVHPAVPSVAGPLCLAVAALALGRYFRLLSVRDHPMTAAEGSFLVSSLLLFNPYLWVKDSNAATFAMLIGHFIQYLSIVWLVHHRKFPRPEGSPRQRLLARVAATPWSVAAMCAAVGVSFFAFQQVTEFLGISTVYAMLWNALALVHFYLDGLIWAFREPFVRRSIGAYLTVPGRAGP